MVTTHSSNSIITKAVAALNKAIKAKAYRSILSGFKVKSKVQFISNIVSAKIQLPEYWGFGSLKTKKQKTDLALSFWNAKIDAHTHSYSECNILYVRPQAPKGYGAILNAASKLGEFSWAQLLLSIPHYSKEIREAYDAWKKYSGCRLGKSGYRMVYGKGKPRMQFVSYNSYVNNYLNSYRAYFVKNRIMAKVAGKRGVYQLTDNGKLLLKGVNQIMR